MYPASAYVTMLDANIAAQALKQDISNENVCEVPEQILNCIQILNDLWINA